MRVTVLSYSLALSLMACAEPDDPGPAQQSSMDSTITGSATTSSNSSSETSATTTTGTLGSGGTTTGGPPQTSAASVTGAGGNTIGMSSTGSVSTTVGTGAGGNSTTGAASGTSGSTMTGAASGTGGSTMTGAASGTGGSGTTGGEATCDSGPLAAPLPNCSPTPVPDTGDYYEDCVARINQFRWECQCLPPLDRWEEGEDCADQHAEYDYEQGTAHAGIRANICEPGNAAQNECPDYGPNFGIIDFFLQQMWDEGPGEPFEVHGHYLNMSDPDFSRVACGIFVTPEGNTWAVQNFQ